MMSDHARRFFEVELRNERDGGVSPATIGSAIESANQAPTDVLDSWMGRMSVRGESANEAAGTLRSELANLRDRFGGGFRLQELLDLADQQPIEFICFKCGCHELEEVRTGVVIVSRVVGRLPGEQLFMYGDRNHTTNESAPHYRCGACQQHIADDQQEMNKLLDEVALKPLLMKPETTTHEPTNDSPANQPG